ncbi:3-oxoacyl-ACP reductase FabG [Candidatus Dependentiae bacterium]
MQSDTSFNSLVTGGVQGIGYAIVKTLVKRGDNVFVFDILPLDDDRVKKIQNIGVQYFLVDISSVDAIKNGISQVFKFLSSQNLSLDLLVNNAGISKDTLAIRMKESDWDLVLNVNLKGSFFCSQQVIQKMIRQKKSYIINISSIVGKTGNIGQSNYAASKAGLIAITKSLAAEYGSRNILINAIAPGFIKTDMTDRLPEKIKNEILNRISLKRFGAPEDVANLVDFLSCGNADYISGAIIDLNGGMQI